MTEGRPLVHIAIPSKIVGDLMKAFIRQHYQWNCVLSENRPPGQITGKAVFVICEWHDFVAGHILPPFCEGNTPEPSPEKPFYIVINTLKGEEKELVHSHEVCKIRGLFYTDAPLETFAKGFTAILNDEVWVPHTVLMDWMSAAGTIKMARCQGVLSSREIAILQQVASGRSNKEISSRLSISTNTVKAHLYNIYKKLGVSNRVQAAFWASGQLSEQSVNRW